MIQSTYTSVSNADIVPCSKKGQSIKSEPIPLLRNNYLGEYRTELEKAKVRKNLGIADEYSLQWGNIEGFVESQEDLVNYIESKWEYTNEISEDISTVSEALDYVIYFVSNFKSDTESIQRLFIEISNLQTVLNSTKAELQKNIQSNTVSIGSILTSIVTIDQQIATINQQIVTLNDSLTKINVDANILNWVKNNTQNSETIKMLENNTLESKISEIEGNALYINQGLFVKDYSEEISKLSIIEENIKANSEAIQNSNDRIDGITEYKTDLSDDTRVPSSVGGISEGTTVSSLKGKTVNEIIDIILFPSYVRPLVYPQLYYTPVTNLVKVGSTIEWPVLNFIKGDAGEEISKESVLLDPLESQISDTTYSKLGTYTFQGSVHYGQGEELLNNKNELSGKFIPEGSLETTFQVNATYPWYTSYSKSITPSIEQPLVKFGQSVEVLFSLQGQAQIWIPGKNSRIDSFTVNVGLGEYLNVDWNGWSKEPEIIQYNGIDYQVWTKNDSYAALLSHKIKFTLAL